MAKELLIYGSIDSETSSQFIEGFNQLTPDEEISVRVNCNGGSPEYGWGMVAKFAEHAGPKKVKVDGKAYSMGMFMLCYADEAEALDVSEFLLHRAAYPSWVESNPDYFTQPMKENLQRINASLMAAFKNKVDVEAFEQLKGVKLKDVFSMDSRIDVFFSAADAKKIGLITKVNKITPQKKAEIDAFMEVAAKTKGFEIGSGVEDKPEKENKSLQTKQNMTLEQLKSEHPAVYAQAVQEGVQQEQDRVAACLVFMDADPAGVKAAIESGKALSQKQMAEFALKAMNPASLKALEKESSRDVSTDEAPAAAQSENEKKLADFTQAVKAELQIK